MAEVQKDDQIGNREDTMRFIFLVQMFAQQAMMQLGKIMNPLTQKTERDLDGAAFTIGMLEMLEEKTRNNLSADEEKLLKNILTDLRLNFVEEMERSKKQPETTGAPATAPTDKDEKSAEEKPSNDEANNKKKFHKKYE